MEEKYTIKAENAKPYIDDSIETRLKTNAVIRIREEKIEEAIVLLNRYLEISKNNNVILEKLKKPQPIDVHMLTDKTELDNEISIPVIDYLYKSLISEYDKDDAIKAVAELKRISEHKNLSMNFIFNHLLKYISFDYLTYDAVEFFVTDDSVKYSNLNHSKELLRWELDSMITPKSTDYIEVYEYAANKLIYELNERFKLSEDSMIIIKNAFYLLAMNMDMENHPITSVLYYNKAKLNKDKIDKFIKLLRKNCLDKNEFDNMIQYLDESDDTKYKILNKVLYLMNPDSFSFCLLKNLFFNDKDTIKRMYEKNRYSYRIEYLKSLNMDNNERCYHILNIIIEDCGLLS